MYILLHPFFTLSTCTMHVAQVANRSLSTCVHVTKSLNAYQSMFPLRYNRDIMIKYKLKCATDGYR